ncbi:MAG TPA: tRNA 2-selenouridine(34) synthase MnmH [Ferruginibacter sp.]|nr:tRNA 2-selenouridine(34) synthase MnmH [Ferruginibacter sp.]
MPVKKISIETFLELSSHLPVMDVRSPGEYIHAQIPGAFSLPLFSDEERKVVGTAYKQQGKQKAIKFGLDFFGVKMRGMVEEVEKIIGSWQSGVGSQELAVGSQELAVKRQDSELSTPDSELQKPNRILIHCWRGGMRSGAVSWLLDLYGFEVYVLTGGYKAYRNWVLSQFEKEYDFKILGGYTGSGKTTILHELEKNNQTIVDLEKLANHKGSAFGGIGQGDQPTQEMFENLLATDLHKKEKETIWLEDESQRIGRLHIPHPLWNTMRAKRVFFVDIPFHERLIYIVKEYGVCDKEQLLQSIQRIQKRLGPLETKTAIAHLYKNEIEECFGILLLYYDKHYKKGLLNRENIDHLLNKIPASSVDSIINAEKLVICNTANM